MSFYSEASLAYVASAGAGKDGKAYSMKPVDGTGDFTFSRGSNLAATRVGPTGLIEKGRENLLLQSNQFDTTWINGNTTETSGQSGYDGSSNAWLLEKNPVAFSYINQNVSVSGVFTFSVYAKANTLSEINLRISTGTRAVFDLSNGTTSSQLSKITDVGNGWYRCEATFIDTINSVRIYPDWGESDAGSIYIQDAQLEIGLAATDYIESGATTGKAGLLEDEPRFDYSGGATCPSLLLEPSRTNLVRLSEAVTPGSYGWTLGSGTTLTLNDAISPEGVKNAFRLDIPTAINTTLARCNVLESTQYTFSFYVKRGTATELKYSVFNFSTLGNIVATTSYFSQTNTSDFVRIVVPFTTPVGCTDVGVYLDRDSGANGSAWFYGIQVEEGSYPTSYIPNHSGGSVTRGEDFVSQSANADNFSDSEGTIFFDGVLFDNDGSAVMAGVDSGSLTDRIRFDRWQGKLRFFAAKDGSTLFNETNVMSLTPGTRYKVAARYKANDYALYVNGVQKYTNTSAGTWDSGDLVRFAFSEGNNSSPTEGNVNQILYFPTGLSNADLETLTT